MRKHSCNISINTLAALLTALLVCFVFGAFAGRADAVQTVYASQDDELAVAGRAYNYLNTYEKALYGKVLVKAKAVASGAETTASLNVPLSEFVEDQAVLTNSYTAEDLSTDEHVVSSLIETDGQGGNAITEAAREAMYSKLAVSTNKVIYALIMDHPHEFYWFDKISGMHFITSFQMPDDHSWIKFGESGKAMIELMVSKDYAKSGKAGTETDPDKISRAVSVIEKADAIVSKYAGKSDIEKLRAFKKEIIELTDYDFDAAGQTGGYGDPWQMINVFDGDSSTNVVCEGYAKAFKYLCDKSAFEDPSFKCILAKGALYDETNLEGALTENNEELHMWNIVTLDGKNYIVDLTNNDSVQSGNEQRPSVARFEELFLAGGAHELKKVGNTKLDGYEIKWKDRVEYAMFFVYDKDMERAFSEADRAISAEPIFKLDTSEADDITKRINALPNPNTIGVKDEAAITAIRSDLDSLDKTRPEIAGYVLEKDRNSLKSAERALATAKANEAAYQAAKKENEELNKRRDEVYNDVFAELSAGVGTYDVDDLNRIGQEFVDALNSANTKAEVEAAAKAAREKIAGLKKKTSSSTSQDVLNVVTTVVDPSKGSSSNDTKDDDSKNADSASKKAKKAAASMKKAAAKVSVKGFKVKAGKKKAVLSWKKISAKLVKSAGVKGYQIVRATKKNGKYKKVTQLKSVKKTKYTNKKLKKGKKYFYKIRTYSKVNGKTVCGKWSKALKVKVK